MHKAAAIIAAAGSGSRSGLTTPKQLYELDGTPVFVFTIKAFQQVSEIDTIILVVSPDFREQAEKFVDDFGLSDKLTVINGGRLRQDSVKAGFDALPDNIDTVLVHDAARPFVEPSLIKSCLQTARQHGAAIAAIPIKDTIKKVSQSNTVSSTIDRDMLWQAQTPQAARVEILQKAFDTAQKNDFVGTDEASLLEHIGYPVTIVTGSEKNIKITHPEDIALAEAIAMHKKHNPLSDIVDNVRIGHGYDAHQLVKDRKLILGGETIPHNLGLLGHSDADVLTHALCDALLGALGCGDIGKHFPDSDPSYKDAHSIGLLREVMKIAVENGYKLINADVTVLAQKPKLGPYFEKMKKNLAQACGVSADVINLKASTTEYMGFVGREEGIAAHSVVLMQKINCK